MPLNDDNKFKRGKLAFTTIYKIHFVIMQSGKSIIKYSDEIEVIMVSPVT